VSTPFRPVERSMPTQLVNLDAMIPREDFEERESGKDTGSRRIAQIRVEDLEQGKAVFAMLRKPDFQRVTANWSPDKVADFVESFINEEFVPSLIMWESKLNGKLFVIDGAHRLSALMAWVNNDYGSGAISRKFFGDDGISDAQTRFAKLTSRLIEKVGSFADLKSYAQHPERAPNEALLVRARKLFTTTLDLQWVIGDPQTAERSFFKINVSATMIDDTELAILKARSLPNAIATRALIHAGRGHKFWVDFGEAEQKEIEELAHKAHDVLFKPILQDPITTTELPVAGGSYSSQSFRMLIDLVNMVNDISPRMWMETKGGQGKKANAVSTRLPEDKTGSETIRYLKAVNKAASLISGGEARSLGLHPVVYFYGDNGLFQPAALLSAIKFFSKLRDERLLIDFTDHRFEFEEFLVHHRHYINQLAKSKGSRTRPVDSFVALYEMVLREVKQKRSHAEIVSTLRADVRLRDLEDVRDEDRIRKKFSKDVRSAAYLKQAVEAPLRCAICRARMRPPLSSDHIVRIEDGGAGSEDNLQFTHFFCNTGYKEHRHHANDEEPAVLG
jgi:hypothetical protein